MLTKLVYIVYIKEYINIIILEIFQKFMLFGREFRNIIDNI